MKNLLSTVTIILLSIFISCSNNEKTDAISKNILIHDSIIKAAEDSILFAKIRIEDSINIEVKEAFIKDSINQVEIETSRLIINKVLDSIYPIWRAHKLDYEEKDFDYIINKQIKIIDWLVEIGKNRPEHHISTKSLQEEFKNLLQQLDTSKNWAKDNLIHPILGTYTISSPGIEFVDYIGYEMINEGPRNKEELSSDLTKTIHNALENISNKNIENVNIMMKNVLIPFSTVVFGGGADAICTEGVDIIGYIIITNFPYNFINDSLINYLAKKNHIDTTSFERILVGDPEFVPSSYSKGSVLSFSTIKAEDDRYYYLRRMLLINILSKTDPLKLALYLIQNDLGITNLDLIDCKGGVELKINTLSNAGSPMVWQVNGKLYYAGYDISDNEEDYEN